LVVVDTRYNLQTPQYTVYDTQCCLCTYVKLTTYADCIGMSVSCCGSRGRVFALVGLLVFGTCASLLGKVEYQVAGQVHGQQKLFRKPLFATFVMFVGMSGCAVVYILQSLFSLLERHGFIKKVLGSLSSTMRYLFASGPIAAGGSVERSIPSEDDCIADCGSNPGEFDTSTGAPQSSVKQTFQANARSLIWNQRCNGF